jgi:hypothetical protein
MRRRFLTGLVVVAACATATGRASADLVLNGGFETGDFTSWTQTGNTGFTNVGGTFSGVPPHGGSSQAHFGAVNSLGGIDQTLATTTGATYTLSFFLYNFGGMGTEYTVSFGGTTLVDVVDAPSFGYTLFTYQVTAASNADVLSFSFQQNPSYFLLDDISVVGRASTPEPGSMLLMGIGGAGLGLFYRSRRGSRSSSVASAA